MPTPTELRSSLLRYDHAKNNKDIMFRKELFRDIIRNNLDKYKRTEEDLYSKIFKRYMQLLADDFMSNGIINLYPIPIVLYICRLKNRVVKDKFTGEYKYSAGVDWNKTFERWADVGMDHKRIYKTDKYRFAISMMTQPNSKYVKGVKYYYFKASRLLLETMKSHIKDNKYIIYADK